MKERPILFSGEMVRAILAGYKSQTRRVVRLTSFEQAPGRKGDFYFRDRKGTWNNITTAALVHGYCPYGVTGDRLWVRETWTNTPYGPLYRASVDDDFEFVDPPYVGCQWRPSIFMPREVSRIMLEVVKVRVERVQDISEAGAVAEGITTQFPNRGEQCWTYKTAYARLWDDINAKRGFGWKVNPWVWVVEFKAA